MSTHTLVLLVTALACVCAQDVTEERKIYRKSKIKPLAANIHDGQGKKMNGNISFAGNVPSFLLHVLYLVFECCLCFPLFAF